MGYEAWSQGWGPEGTCAGGQIAGSLLHRLPHGAVSQAGAHAPAPCRASRVCAAAGAGGPRRPWAPVTWGGKKTDRGEAGLGWRRPWACPFPKGAMQERWGGLGLPGKAVTGSTVDPLAPVLKETLLRNASQPVVHLHHAQGWQSKPWPDAALQPASPHLHDLIWRL